MKGYAGFKKQNDAIDTIKQTGVKVIAARGGMKFDLSQLEEMKG